MGLTVQQVMMADAPMVHAYITRWGNVSDYLAWPADSPGGANILEVATRGQRLAAVIFQDYCKREVLNAVHQTIMELACE